MNRSNLFATLDFVYLPVERIERQMAQYRPLHSDVLRGLSRDKAYALDFGNEKSQAGRRSAKKCFDLTFDRMFNT